MIRILTINLILCFWITSGSLVGQAAEVETTVKYVSAESIYLDAGSGAGIDRGDSAKLIIDNQVDIILEIVFVAETSASARIIEGNYTPQIGDKVIVTIAEHARGDSITVAGTPEPLQPYEFPVEDSKVDLTGSKSPTRIRGRLGVELFYQDEREPENADVIRPALTVRSTIENFLMSHLALSVNLRTRYIIRENNTAVDPETEWNNRVYAVALQYNNPESSLHYQAGRISSNHISGIGRFDGALMEYEFREGMRFGAFGGILPNLSTSAPQTDKVTGGFYTVYDKGNWQGHKVAGTMAIAGRYNTGEIDREFLYEQIRYSWRRRFSIYQSAELGINRDWREEAEGSKLSLTNFLLNANYSPSNKISFDFSYDNRTLEHTIETRETPDSLFDDALRQGFRAGINVKLPLRLRVWLRAGLSTREGEGTDTRSVFTGISQRSIANTGVTGSVQLNAFENRYSNGTQISVAAFRYVFRIIYLQFEVGQSSYELDTSQDVINYHWINLGVNGSVSRHLYASWYGEIYSGDTMNTYRFWMEIGYRL